MTYVCKMWVRSYNRAKNYMLYDMDELSEIIKIGILLRAKYISPGALFLRRKRRTALFALVFDIPAY